MTDTMRREVRRLFEVGVAAADPGAAVGASLAARPLPPAPGGVFVVAVGKAAGAMIRAALEVAGPVREALVVTNYENGAAIDGARVMTAGHPVPDEAGLAAGREVIDLLGRAGRAGRAGRGAQVLALISGGGSALLPAPVPGISLADKIAVNQLLLGAGLDISEMNLVRQQLSQLKGGGFLRLAAPAAVTALILSDVVGDDLRVIASGPTVGPIGSRADAVTLLRRAGIWADLPLPVVRALQAPCPEAGPLPAADNRLVGSNALSLRAMARAAPAAKVVEDPLVGDVAAAAQRVLSLGPGDWLLGGETTVRLRGDGRGGRNQELALRVALGAEAAGWTGRWVFLSAGTDGRDGPTDAAGAIVDAGSLARMRAAGIDAAAELARNNSNAALAASGDLLITGATGTNVADLQVLMRR